MCMSSGERSSEGMSNMVSMHTVVAAQKEQVASDLSGEVVILNPQSGIYYGLDGVGTFVWHLIQEPKTVNAVRDAILEEYEVDPERCERDLLALLEKLAAEGLIEVRNETGLQVSTPSVQ